MQSVGNVCDFVLLLPIYNPSLIHLNVVSCSLVREEDLVSLSAQLPDLEIAYNRDLGCSPKSNKVLRYFDVMSPRQFAMVKKVHKSAAYMGTARGHFNV